MPVDRSSERRVRTPARRRFPAPRADPPSRVSSPSRERFLALDSYRADREWKRYEGTPQRDLFRELRLRFLRRHAVADVWAIDIGSGPGRFTGAVGAAPARRVALDLSREMLVRIPRTVPADPGGPGVSVERVEGDALSPPFVAEAFGEVAVVGNAIGFAGRDAEGMLERAERLVAPGGTLIVEVAPGPGERSRYLRRLPAGSVARLFAAPTAAIVPRIAREGFVAEPRRHREAEFRRFGAEQLHGRWAAKGWELRETVAVAPCLGPDPLRVARIRPDPRAWDHLLSVEEEIGRRSDRWPSAAAVLLAVRRLPAGT